MTLRNEPVPALTAEQMREIDRVMVEDLHIMLVQMMENAGRSLAEVAMRRFHPETVTVLAGPGGNGGGGLVAARHLANHGVTVEVSLARAARDLRPVPAHQLDILIRMGISVTDQPRPAALVIDALLGYSLRGDPSGHTGELIDWANRSSCAILALDIPSGLDADTAIAASPCITADATVTLALPKVGPSLTSPSRPGRTTASGSRSRRSSGTHRSSSSSMATACSGLSDPGAALQPAIAAIRSAMAGLWPSYRNCLLGRRWIVSTPAASRAASPCTARAGDRPHLVSRCGCGPLPPTGRQH